MSTLPWYKSNVLRGILVALVLQVAQWLGVTEQISEEALQNTVDNLLHLIEFGALLFSAWARARQPTPPITQSAAEKMAQPEVMIEPEKGG